MVFFLYTKINFKFFLIFIHRKVFKKIQNNFLQQHYKTDDNCTFLRPLKLDLHYFLALEFHFLRFVVELVKDSIMKMGEG